MERIQESHSALWYGLADIQCAFYRVLLLQWLIPYFAAPPVLASALMSDSELAAGGFSDVFSHRWIRASDLVYPACTRLPMGWSHAVAVMLHIGTRRAFRALINESKFLSLNVPSSDVAPLTLAPDQVAGGLFVDNLLVFGEDEQSVNTALRGAVGDLNDSGLTVGEVAWASQEAVYVGLELTQHGMTPKPHQLAMLYNTTKYFASFQKLSGKVLQRVMGFYSWFCSLERLLFSLAGASYIFTAEAGDSWLPLWPSVKKELNQVADMLPLVRTFWAWERSPFVVAQDAEGPNSYDHGGCGVVVRSVSAQDWDWAVKSFPRIPRPLLPSEEDFISVCAWEEVSAIRWFYREHINLGELEAIIEWVKQIVGRFSLPTSGSTSEFFEAFAPLRILAFSDNHVVVGATSKGRSSSFWLRARLKKLAALLIRGNIRLVVVWIPTGFMPADSASRRRPSHSFKQD